MAGRYRPAPSSAAGDPDRIRTCDLPLRRRLLYPAELRGQQGLGATGGRGSVRPQPDAVGAEIVRIGHRATRRVIGRGLLDAIRQALTLRIGDGLLAAWRSGGGSAASCRRSWSSPSAGRSSAALRSRKPAARACQSPGPTGSRLETDKRYEPSFQPLVSRFAPPVNGKRPPSQKTTRNCQPCLQGLTLHVPPRARQAAGASAMVGAAGFEPAT